MDIEWDSDEAIEVGSAMGSTARRTQIRERLAAIPVEKRKPWVKRDEFIAAGRPYFEWFGWAREDIWPELLDEDGIPIPTIHTGAKIGRINISTWENENRSPTEGKRITPGFRATMDNPVPSVQCTYVSPVGKRCGQWSMKGLSVCWQHGGKTDLAKAAAEDVLSAARQRMYSMTDNALAVIERLTAAGSTAPDAVQLKAATEILDRVGLKTPVELEVTVDHRIDPSSIVFGNLDKLAANQRKVIAGESDSDSEIVDAEIVIETDD